MKPKTRGTVAKKNGAGFVPSVKLDPSAVTDRRPAKTKGGSGTRKKS